MQIINFSKALADQTRARLMALLSRHDLNVGEIVTVMQMGQSRVSHHLKVLVDAGLLAARKDGLWTFYTAAANGGGRRYLDALGDLLFEDETGTVESDLERAKAVMEQRNRETKSFFEQAAHDMQGMLREILADYDLSFEIAQRLPSCRVATDLGCGPGLLIPAIRSRADQVIGVDHAPAMLDAAQQRLGDAPGLSLRLGDLTHLPLRDKEADCAVISLALHHLPQPNKAIEEAARVLAPGGTLLVAEFARHDHEHLRSGHGDRWLGFDSSEISGWIEQSGLGSVAVEAVDLSTGLQLLFYTAQKTADQ